MADVLDAIRSLAQEFQHLSATQCAEALAELFDRVAPLREDLTPELCKGLLQFVLSVAAPRCADRRPLQWYCSQLIGCVGRAARCNDGGAARGDLHSFFFKLGKKEVKSQRIWKPKVMIPMLQNIFRYASASGLAGALKGGENACGLDVVTSFLQAVYGEMGRSEKWDKKWRAKSTRVLARVLSISPQILEHALEVMKKDSPPSLLIAAVGSCACQRQLEAPQITALVELYVKCVLESKQPPTEFALESWAQILSLVQPEVFEKQLLPVALRMMKRQPAAMAASFPSLVSYVKFDLGPFAKEVLDPFAIESFRSPEGRARGNRTIRQVVAKASASAAPLAVADFWVDSFKKAGKTDEKQALLTAIAVLVNSFPKTGTLLGTEGLGKLADPKGDIAKAAAAEANEDSRALACRVLGAALLQVPAEASEPLAQELLKQLNDKKSPDKARIAVLECFAEATTYSKDVGPPWLPLGIERSLPITLLAATKPVQRLQSLLAWGVCGELASLQPEKVGAAMKKDHLGLLKDGTSFLNSVSIILKAPAAELAAQAQLWRSVLAGHMANLPTPSAALKTSKGDPFSLPPSLFSDAQPIYRSTIVLLTALHSCSSYTTERPPSPLERLGLKLAVKSLPDEDVDALMLLLVQTLVAWFAELAQQSPQCRQVSTGALRRTLLDLCEVAATVPAKIAEPATFPLLMLLIHHPIMGTSTWPTAKLWKWVCSEGPFRRIIKNTPASLWQSLQALVKNAFKLPANDKSGFRQTCISLAGTLDISTASTQADKDAIRDELIGLVDLCGSSLHSAEVGAEKDNSVLIYFAPEGKLWMEEGTYQAEEVQATNLKKNKFLKGLYDDEEIVVEKKVAAAPSKPASKSASKAKAKPSAKSNTGLRGGPSGAMTGSEIEAAKIQEQSDTRARIRNYLDESTFSLAILAKLAQSKANAAILEAAMPDLVPHFLVLLKCPLTTLQSRRCLRAIVNVTVSDRDVGRRDLLPEALQVVAKNWMARSPSAAGTLGEKPACDEVLESVTSMSALPHLSLSLVLPLILRTLLHSTIALEDVCGKALSVLEKQLHVGAKIPEQNVIQVFESLGIALLALPGQKNATKAAMLAAGKCLVSNRDELDRLADMFYSDDDNVRSTVIAALSEIQDNENFLDERMDALACRAVLRLGALNEKTAEMAQTTLEALELEADEDLVKELVGIAKRPNLGQSLQNLVAQALAQVLTELEDTETSTMALEILMQSFREDAASRAAVARCLEQVFKSNLEDEEQVIKAFKFLLRQALGITNSSSPEAIELRDILLASGIVLIEKHGEGHADILFGAVEDFEDSGAATAAGESARLGVAVFLGALSKHLGADHPKVPEILPRLLQRLLDPESTVSVQNAIVKVMPPLMKQNKERATETLEQLLETALAKKTHEVTRRGAAMGLGGTVKGSGIQAIAKHDVIKRIEAAASDKKEANVRRGALCCLEGLTSSLGRLFDPYVVSSLPLLLQAFSDSSREVQAASHSAASAMMSQLSGPGMKQVLKPLLEGIQDKQWRTKLGSVELLAAMSSCLPKELAKCLPQVVPALCKVINDQHAKVKEAAREALDRIGNIITSPELRALAPELIEALTDGAQFEHITKRVLDQLLGTSFVHHIDAPSLSLVCPLVQRALKERSAEMKRKGAQIVGSMVLLIKDAKDIQPYLPLLLPQLKQTLVDPIPDVRATAAKAFGTLANGLPEDMMGDVLPWMFEMLCSAESAVERQGAAHGLSEVLMAMGTDRIEMLLPDILNKASGSDTSAEKEGYLGLFVYLPAAMGESFCPYLSDVSSTLLRSLADDNSSVRDTAFKAAQVLTKQFGATHTALLLPPLEDGVFDVDWRIRHASVQLMGQLIEQILRAHRIPIQNAELMFCEAFPKEWRAHMLASLYIVRSDEHQVVKQACAQVWKAVVQNTPRTLKELLPALMKRLIANLASTNREKQRVAARCVGDLVSKLGERVMPELMPIFMNTLESEDSHVREGVCIGLAELINATTKQMLADYLGDLIPAIRQAIIDDVESVRNSASIVVALLHNAVGPRATTDVVTWVLAQLQEEEVQDHGHLFLNGLEQLMAKQPGAVLPMLLKSLTEEPEEGWTKLQVQGVAVIAAVPDAHTIHRHLSDVMPVFMNVVGNSEDEDMVSAALESAGRVMDRVEQGGLTLLFADLNAAIQDNTDARRRIGGMKLFEQFFETTQLDIVPMLPVVLPTVLPVALNDDDEEALAAGMRSLNGIVKKVKKEELAPYLPQVRDIIFSLVTDPKSREEDPNKLLPGLVSQNGLEPLYPIYQHGLMFGSPEARELAAKGLGELVNHTTAPALKPYVVKITGPLIRIVGDRFPGTVKKAIVDTLKALLVKGGDTLKPFLPQLQTTYVKCLADPNDAVRQKAGESLGVLVRLSARTEPLIKELCTGLAKEDDEAFTRLAKCSALGEVLLNVPAAVSEAAQGMILDALIPRALQHEATDARDRELSAYALGIVIRRHCSAEKAIEILQGDVATAASGDADTKTGVARTLSAACRQLQQVGSLDPAVLEVLKKVAATACSEKNEATAELKRHLS